VVPVGIDVEADIAGPVEAELIPAVDAVTVLSVGSADVAVVLEAVHVAVYNYPAEDFAAVALVAMMLVAARGQAQTRVRQHLVHFSLLPWLDEGVSWVALRHQMQKRVFVVEGRLHTCCRQSGFALVEAAESGDSRCADIPKWNEMSHLDAAGDIPAQHSNSHTGL
jgi:hypothetical protein